jgi:hypothetical protein
MVVVRTVNRLRERPKDERVAVAGAVAIAVVAVLFIGWVVLFFHGIGSATSSPSQQSVASTTSQ